MGVLALAVIFVCGFIFTNLNLESRFRQRKSTGWATYFHVTAWGLAFVIAGFFFTELIDYFDLPSWLLSHWCSNPILKLNNSFAQISHGALNVREVFASLSSLIFAFGVGYGFRFFQRSTKNRYNLLLKACLGDEIGSLLVQSAEDDSAETLVSVTLESRKCYVGVVCKAQNEETPLENFALIPLLSGYRDNETQELKLTRNYYEFYANNLMLEEEDWVRAISTFRVVLPTSRVVQISLFDLEVYLKFNQENVIIT